MTTDFTIIRKIVEPQVVYMGNIAFLKFCRSCEKEMPHVDLDGHVICVACALNGE